MRAGCWRDGGAVSPPRFESRRSPKTHHERQHSQQQPVSDGCGLVKQTVGKNRTGEGVVAQQGDCPEVAHGVEKHEQAAGRNSRQALRQHHAEKHRERPPPQQPCAFLQRMRQSGKTGAHRQIHIRVCEESEHSPSPPEAVNPRHAFYSQRRENLFNETALGKPRQQGDGPHERRESQRQRRKNRPYSAPRQVGAKEHPRQPSASGRSSNRHRQSQQDGVAQRPPSIRKIVAPGDVEVKAAPDEIAERSDEDNGESDAPRGKPPVNHTRADCARVGLGSPRLQFRTG